MASFVMVHRLVAMALCLTSTAVRAQIGAAVVASEVDEAQPLQGTWIGTSNYGQADQNGSVIVKITGHTLHYQGPKTNDWYDATFTLPTGTIPAQLHAFITASPDKGAIRKQVFAVFRLEAGWLTLAEVEASAIETQKNKRNDESLFNAVDGKLELLGPSASDRWKALEGSMRFCTKMRKVSSETKLDEPIIGK
jgi:hypothetical protein